MIVPARWEKKQARVLKVSLVGEQSRVKKMTHRKNFQTRSLSVSLYIERRTVQNERKGSRDEDEEDEDEDRNGFIPHHSDLCVCVVVWTE